MSLTREINLIPADVIIKQKIQLRIRTWAGVMLLVLVFLLGGYAVEKRHVIAAEQHVADLSLKNREIEEKVKQLHILKEKRDRLAKKEKIINTLMHKRSLSLVFSELEQVMNQNVVLTGFDFKDTPAFLNRSSTSRDSDEWVEPGYFIIKKNSPKHEKEFHDNGPRVTAFLQGIAETNSDLAGFLENLSESIVFYEVNLKYSREGIYESLNVVEFEIEAQLASDM